MQAARHGSYIGSIRQPMGNSAIGIISSHQFLDTTTNTFTASKIFARVCVKGYVSKFVKIFFWV
jgi:hypothetical protein